MQADYFSEWSKACGVRAEEERLTEIVEGERTEEGDNVVKKSTYVVAGETHFY